LQPEGIAGGIEKILQVLQCEETAPIVGQQKPVGVPRKK
jgi:hypothetical protein